MEHDVVVGQEAAGAVAAFGSLEAEVVSDIAVLREFILARQRHLARLLGRRLRESPLRDELLRLVLLCFGAGRHERLAFYASACAVYGTEPSVRAEIDILVSAGVIVLTRDPSHPRAVLVMPTVKLVRFYNEQMPRLRVEVGRLLRV